MGARHDKASPLEWRWHIRQIFAGPSAVVGALFWARDVYLLSTLTTHGCSTGIQSRLEHSLLRSISTQ